MRFAYAFICTFAILILAGQASAQVGACCADGSCINGTTQVDCEIKFGGVWRGAGSVCGATTCTAGCCFPDGGCENISSATFCAQLGGTSQGLGNVCGSSTYSMTVMSHAFEDISADPGATQHAAVLIGGAGSNSTIVGSPLNFFKYFNFEQSPSVVITANGVVAFRSLSPSGTSPNNVPFPTLGNPQNIASAYWDDLLLSTSSKVSSMMRGVAPQRRLIIQWTDMMQQLNSITGGNSNTFEVILYEGSNCIEFRYADITPNGAGNPVASFNAGLENSTGTYGVDVTSLVADNVSILFCPINPPCSPATGGCCIANVCSVLSQAACLQANGTYNGNGSNCSGTPCGPPPVLEACCFPNGTCQNLTVSQCGTQGGTHQGRASTCAGVVCPPPVQACCLPNGSCQNLTPAACTTAGGSVFGGGFQCASVQCLASPCCMPDRTCIVIDPSFCVGMGGLPGNPNTTCAQAQCHPGDVNGDGYTNVDDLLAIINTWGPCAAPCPTDIAPPGGNGFVNVDDLLVVINGWG